LGWGGADAAAGAANSAMMQVAIASRARIAIILLSFNICGDLSRPTMTNA
jgi:hypothetical protein